VRPRRASAPGNVRSFQSRAAATAYLSCMNKPSPSVALPAASAPVLSVSPIVLPVPGRPVPLEVRVTAPLAGRALPVLLLSHGHGPSGYVSSLYGYAPLANFYAAYGFVVVQPTHLDSRTLPLRESDHPAAPLFWRSRAEDMSRILDQLEAIERAVPTLAGRVDRTRVVVVGHSMGGHTASVLLGAAQPGEPSVAEPRISAGVLLAAPGRGTALSAYAAEHYPFFAAIDFTTLQTPTLVVAGDADASPHLTTAGAAWHADPYHLAPGAKALVWLAGGGHGLGGVSAYDAAETTDESPARVAAVQRLSAAFLRSQLDPGDAAWADARASLDPAIGRVEAK
jgi:predicted dienelactone hydrolase